MKYKAVFYARIVHVLLVRINKCTVWFHLLIGADNNTQCENEDENEEMIVAVNAIYCAKKPQYSVYWPSERDSKAA